jgi:uncharacterized protein YehS (DUF1456 family)
VTPSANKNGWNLRRKTDATNIHVCNDQLISIFFKNLA